MIQSDFIKFTLQLADRMGIDILGILGKIGDMLNLQTNHKITLVGAINEVYRKLDGYLQPTDLNGFVYNVNYNPTNHVLTFFRQNQPNYLIDLDLERLIMDIELVGNNLLFTFEDGSQKSIPLNSLLVGVMKSANGLTPNAQGEIILNIGDIPSLQSSLDALTNKIGYLPGLSTNDKNSLVEAVNEVNGYIFSLNQQYHYNFNFLETINQHLSIASEPVFGGALTVGYNIGGFLGFDSNKDYAFLNNGGAHARILTGGILASDAYLDGQYIPYLGGYFKGTIATANHLTSYEWAQSYNERVIQFNITYTTNVFTFSVLLANGVQKQANLQTNATHFTINSSGVLQLNAAIAQKIADAATVTQLNNKVDKGGDTMYNPLRIETNDESYVQFSSNGKDLNLGYGGYINGGFLTLVGNVIMFVSDAGNFSLGYGVYSATERLEVNGRIRCADGVANNHAATIGQLSTKANAMENATGIGFANGSFSGLPYFYHSSGVHKHLATVDYINAQGYTTEGWVLQQISNSASPYRYFQGNIFSDTPNFSNNTINGKGNQALGSYILHKGSRSTLIGDHIVSEGNYINAIGRRGSFSGGYISSYGAYNTATGAHINLFGNYLTGSKSNYTAIGNYNKFDLLNPEKEQNKVVVIGSGKSEYERENAIEVYTDNSSGFRGKAFYDEETRNPEWFGEQGTLVDTTVAGMHHLDDRAESYVLDSKEGMFGLVVRQKSTTGKPIFKGETDLTYDFYNTMGIVDGINVSSVGGLNSNKVHHKGTIKYNTEQSSILLQKYPTLNQSNAYTLNMTIVVLDDFTWIGTGLMDRFEMHQTAVANDGQAVILGSFYTGVENGQTHVYFEFNRTFYKP